MAYARGENSIIPVIIGQSGHSATGSIEREIINSGSGGRDILDSSSLMALSNRHLRFMNGYHEVGMILGIIMVPSLLR